MTSREDALAASQTRRYLRERLREMWETLDEVRKILSGLRDGGMVDTRTLLGDFVDVMRFLDVRTAELDVALGLLATGALLAERFPNGGSAIDATTPRQILYRAGLVATEQAEGFRSGMRCTATTKAGRRCSNAPIFGSERCRTHASPVEREVAAAGRDAPLTVADILGEQT